MLHNTQWLSKIMNDRLRTSADICRYFSSRNASSQNKNFFTFETFRVSVLGTMYHLSFKLRKSWDGNLQIWLCINSCGKDEVFCFELNDFFWLFFVHIGYRMHSILQYFDIKNLASTPYVLSNAEVIDKFFLVFVEISGIRKYSSILGPRYSVYAQVYLLLLVVMVSHVKPSSGFQSPPIPSFP